jgi:alkyl hydroperoxide reductase subunit AhpC
LGEIEIPLLSDLTKSISRDYGVLIDDAYSLRGTFIIDKAQLIRHVSINDAPVGRNVDEIYRLV